MQRYVLSVDQSTQGTKAMLFDADGIPVSRVDIAHRQIINEMGWVSHDPEEIFQNLLEAVGKVIRQADIDANLIHCMGISNQRETAVAWNLADGKPVCDAIVWQCARAAGFCERLNRNGFGDYVKENTGIVLSPYFTAAKIAWILENVPAARELAGNRCLGIGTIDTWLLYKLTGQYKTDFSNASRTQLFNIRSLKWDEQICHIFGIPADSLPEVTASDSLFGDTDLGGLLKRKIPIFCILGDSQAALFGQNCVKPGMTKATYGTGSSIMMNIGEQPVFSSHGLMTSVAWKYRDTVHYVMEGNINYAGAVVSWLRNDLGLIASSADTDKLAREAQQADTTYLVPAFTGLGAPYWNNEAKAILCGMTRMTGKNEVIRAALDSIAYQIHDVVDAMSHDMGFRIPVLKADGGATHNEYLMQFQSDLLSTQVFCSNYEELSAIGVAYMAGLAANLYTETVFDNIRYRAFSPKMSDSERSEKLEGWKEAIRMLTGTQYTHVR